MSAQPRARAPVAHAQDVGHDRVAGAAAHKRLQHLGLEPKRTWGAAEGAAGLCDAHTLGGAPAKQHAPVAGGTRSGAWLDVWPRAASCSSRRRHRWRAPVESACVCARYLWIVRCSASTRLSGALGTNSTRPSSEPARARACMPGATGCALGARSAGSRPQACCGWCVACRRACRAWHMEHSQPASHMHACGHC